MSTKRSFRRGFTLVEILIVVVIMGILAAVVTPQFTSATQEAASQATYTELQKIRRHVEIFRARNADHLPDVQEGDGTWGQLVSSEHLMAPPVNAWVNGENSRQIVFGDAPDAEFHQDYAWIYNPATGDIWAAGFDEDDEPLPR